MKTIKIIIVSLLGFVCVLGHTNAQVISLPLDGQVEQSFQLKSPENANPAKLNMTFSYDVTNQEITIICKLNKGLYDMLWLPMKSYDDLTFKRAVNQSLHGKLKMLRPFKNKLTFGLVSAFDYYNCELVSTVRGGISEELLGVKDSMVMRLRVLNPQRTVRLTLRSAAPVQTEETPSGKLKYIFMYIADKMTIEMTVPEEPVDPCDENQNLVLFDTVKHFYDTINKGFELITNSIDQKKWKECYKNKHRFENEYAEQLQELRTRYDDLPIKCTIINEVLESIGSTFEIIEDMQCPRMPKPRPEPIKDTIAPPTTQVIGQLAKTIKSYADELNMCINSIRIGRDVKKNKDKGKNIMAKADATISDIPDSQKDNPSLREAVKSYELAKESFKKNASRK